MRQKLFFLFGIHSENSFRTVARSGVFYRKNFQTASTNKRPSENEDRQSRSPAAGFRRPLAPAPA
ncbi:hypothetical protein HMPREF9120_02081 [Neisseria sp. oral taxon 020 str. F0370]|nr:hypothetical protein HMPREF9120_02081 [Neisseria sp. oral taxon 020 str. F0370]